MEATAFLTSWLPDNRRRPDRISMTHSPIPSADAAYATCPRCGLRVRVRWSTLTLEHCPRCVARFRRLVQMTLREPATSGARARDGHRA